MSAEEMRRMLTLLEGRDAPLYHSTTLGQATAILNSGYILPASEYISLTRDPNLWFGSNNVRGGQVTFVIDQRALARNFRIIPYDFYGQEGGYGRLTPQEHESEERINTINPIPVSKYVTQVWIDKDMVDRITGMINAVPRQNASWQYLMKDYINFIEMKAESLGIPLVYKSKPIN